MKRTITVFNQNTQEKSVFTNVEASTVGELRSFLTGKGYNLTNMDLREGVSRTDLKADSSQLPHDIPYKGSTTNDLLVFMTLKNKNVSSGMDRNEAVAYMKANGLEDEVKKACGDNWTRVSTANLVNFCEKYRKSGSETKPAADNTPANAAQNTPAGAVDAVVALAGLLADNGTIQPEQAAKIQEIAVTKIGYSIEEIRDLL